MAGLEPRAFCYGPSSVNILAILCLCPLRRLFLCYLLQSHIKAMLILRGRKLQLSTTSASVEMEGNLKLGQGICGALRCWQTTNPIVPDHWQCWLRLMWRWGAKGCRFSVLKETRKLSWLQPANSARRPVTCLKAFIHFPCSNVQGEGRFCGKGSHRNTALQQIQFIW